MAMETEMTVPPQSKLEKRTEKRLRRVDTITMVFCFIAGIVVCVTFGLSLVVLRLNEEVIKARQASELNTLLNCEMINIDPRINDSRCLYINRVTGNK